MWEETKKITQRIRTIRELDHRKIEDCASFLGISTEKYQKIENDEGGFTLPEIELLALLFRVPVTSFFEDSPVEEQFPPSLTACVRDDYKKLRNRMILAKIKIESKKQDISLEDIQTKTETPLESYDTFINGMSWDNLQQICNELSISISSLLEGALNPYAGADEEVHDENWTPEYPVEPAATDYDIWDENNFEDLVKAIKRAPKDEQALMAKILLEELREI